MNNPVKIVTIWPALLENLKDSMKKINFFLFDFIFIIGVWLKTPTRAWTSKNKMPATNTSS